MSKDGWPCGFFGHKYRPRYDSRPTMEFRVDKVRSLDAYQRSLDAIQSKELPRV